MQKKSQKSVPAEVASLSPTENMPPATVPHLGAHFDDTTTLSDLKKLQDATKFDKARFSFRLYKR